LEKLHEIGLFHRDIKPKNILVRQDDTACLGDFGSCARAPARGRGATAHFRRRRADTEEYKQVDDVFSFGKTVEVFRGDGKARDRSHTGALDRLIDSCTRPSNSPAIQSSKKLRQTIQTIMEELQLTLPQICVEPMDVENLEEDAAPTVGTPMPNWVSDGGKTTTRGLGAAAAPVAAAVVGGQQPAAPASSTIPAATTTAATSSSEVSTPETDNVWVTKTGLKYHLFNHPPMRKPQTISLASARKKTRGLCKKCIELAKKTSHGGPFVYVAKSGRCYHKRSGCYGADQKWSLTFAIKKQRKKCKKCILALGE